MPTTVLYKGGKVVAFVIWSVITCHRISPLFLGMLHSDSGFVIQGLLFVVISSVWYSQALVMLVLCILIMVFFKIAGSE
jgi:hypothetical protein